MTKMASQPRAPADGISVSRFDMMVSVSTAIDLMDSALVDHHNLVCFIAASLAHEMGLDPGDYNDVFVAALFHDIGAIALDDRLALLEDEKGDPNLHARLGATLLENYRPLAAVAPLVRFHHIPWAHGRNMHVDGEEVPVLAHLIHLADRIAVQIDPGEPIFSQTRDIEARIWEQSGEIFQPGLVDVFKSLAEKEVFWLDTRSAGMPHLLATLSRLPDLRLDLDGLTDLARFFALIIDTRCRFTATHSSGVAACSAELARLVGLPDLGCRKMELAGYLHDIGKLAIPLEFIEKPGPLSKAERRIINAHPYFTYRVLESVAGLEDVTLWAAQHHEHLSGDGYPFHVGEGDISLESRIVAVSDVFTALSEERPYRSQFSAQTVREILTGEARKNHLDQNVVELALDNYVSLKEACRTHQRLEDRDLADFWETARRATRRNK